MTTDISKILEAVELKDSLIIKDDEELGKGAYGRVFTIRYRGVKYAAKEIHSILYEGTGYKEQKRVRESFYRECQYCRKLRHPNIVTFIGVYYPSTISKLSKAVQLPIMVMELMECSLTCFVLKKSGKIDMKTKHSILLDVACGVNYLHDQRPPVIHRDLSPNNVMLSSCSSQIVAKIGDLGVAKAIGADSKSTRSKLTNVPGTADFMPPETTYDNPNYGTPLDMFSFGGITLYVITEEWPNPKAPIKFDNQNHRTIAFSEVERRQHHLDKIRDAAALKAFVEKCLDNAPKIRPTATDAINLLKVCEYT